MTSWHSLKTIIRKIMPGVMKRQEMLCLFDVDGTLTVPRNVIETEMKDFLLRKVQTKCAVGLIGGSDLPKIQEQMGGEDILHTFDYVFTENGLVAFKDGKSISNESIQTHLGEDKLQQFINGALEELSKIRLPLKRGTFIEFRKGMLNISPIGRSCSQAERDDFEKYDHKHKVRQELIDKLRARFPDIDLVYSIGGQISFDVVPKGWDKTFALSLLDWSTIKEVHFFGDRTDPGGNDHEIFCDPRVTGHKVTSPLHTKEKLCTLLNL